MSPKEAQAMEELGVVPDSVAVFSKKRAQSFDTLVSLISEQQAIKKQAEAEVKRLQTALESYFADSPSKTVLSEGRRVTLVMSSNSHLDKKMLIEAGVPAQTILDCTRTTNYTFVKITAAKETA